MKIALLGYGRMNKIVEQLLLSRGHTLAGITDENNKEIVRDADCYIDFSTAAVIHEYIESIAKLNIPLVIATTGWLVDKAKFEKIILENKSRALWSGNFSLGVNIFWKSLEGMSKVFAHYPGIYDVAVHEWHHRQKADAPSGTAIQTATILQQAIHEKKLMQTEKSDRKIKQEELHVTSTRLGNIPGTHTVLFDSEFDTIEFTHTARTREGFAIGAVMAAEKIHSLPIGLHNFYDSFDIIFK